MMSRYFVISTTALMRREVVRVARLWRQTVFPSVITTVLYFAIFGFVLGQRVGMVDGIDYSAFVAPGLVMLALTINSYSNTAFSVYIEKFHTSLDELLSSPMSDHQIILGFIVGGIFRGVICALTVWLVSWGFVGYFLAHPWFAVFSVMLAATMFSLMGLVNGLIAKSFDDLNVMTVILLNPLVMLGGIFYSVNMLSDTWQAVAWFNPMLYVGNLFRYCMVGVTNISPYLVCSVLFGLILFFYSAAYFLMRKTTYVRQ